MAEPFGPRPPSGFTIANGVATVHDPALYTSWMLRSDYCDALTASPDPVLAANKRLAMDFEVALARWIEDSQPSEDVETVLARFIAEDYIQHDAAIGRGRRALADFLRRGGFGGTPPPPIGLIAEGALVTVLLQLPPSLQGGCIAAIFRVADGRLAEHWPGGAVPLPASAL